MSKIKELSKFYFLCPENCNLESMVSYFSKNRLCGNQTVVELELNKFRITRIMLYFPLRHLFRISHNVKVSVRSIVNASTQLNPKLSHIYSKTWTKSELIQCIKDNIVYETDDYIVTSVPQGVALKRTAVWLDSVDFLPCESDLNDILKEIPTVLKTESILLTRFPTRNASGLVILSKNHKSHTLLKKNISLGQFNNEYIFNYLAVVLGCPERIKTQTFGIQPFKVEDKYGTTIFQNFKNVKNIRKTFYHHEVLASSEHASLVRVEVSNDVRDCVRHILATRCSTPVLGDSYNYVKMKSNFMGVPLDVDTSLTKNSNSVKLNPDLLKELKLKSGDEKLIPIHNHFHGMKVTLKKNVKFFVCVPPGESFVWTCRQLGLHEIDHFQKI